MDCQELFESVLHVGTDAFQAWFAGSKVVDKQGNPLPVYHGTARPDRVGNRFQKNRATAGPMAYFTDDSSIASNYAQNKEDSSLEVDGYNEWFKVKVGRTSVPIDKAWYSLPSDEKQRILKLAPRVTGESDEIFLDGPEQDNGVGNYKYSFIENKRNPLATLVDGWLNGGALYGEEQDFLKVLRLAGMTTPVSYEHPNAAYPYVYKVYLSIKNPLNTNSIPQGVIDALTKVSARQRRPSYVGGNWNKKATDPKTWLQGLMNDLKNNTTYSWTVIPDWVTKCLESFGYDGIQDTGGKHSGIEHAVWIPFHEHQVKSAISNKGTFDGKKRGLSF